MATKLTTTRSAHSMPMRTQRQCYLAGKRAFNQGLPVDENPQIPVTMGHSEWRRGWLEAWIKKSKKA